MRTVTPVSQYGRNTLPMGTNLGGVAQITYDGSVYKMVEYTDALQSPLPSDVANAPAIIQPNPFYGVAGRDRPMIWSVTTTPFTITRSMMGLNCGTGVDQLSYKKPGIVRIQDGNTRWKFIETSAGVYSAGVLALLDSQINAAYDGGCEIIYAIGETPTSRSRYPTSSDPLGLGTAWCPGTAGTPGAVDYSSLTAFVTFILDRYAGKISAVDGWNEPIVSNTYKDTMPNLIGFNQAIWDAVQAWNLANSGSVKMISITNSNWDGVSGAGFTLEQFFANGDQNHANVIGYHIYRGGRPYLASDRQLLELVQQRMTDSGVSKDLWVTEVGDSMVSNYNEPNYFARQMLYYLAAGAKKVLWYSWGNAGVPDMRISQVPKAWYDSFDLLNGAYVEWVNIMNGRQLAAKINGKIVTI